MEDDRKKFLFDIVGDYEAQCMGLNDAAWVFILEIAKKNDSSLFNIASDEIKSEILKVVDVANSSQSYKIYVAHSAEQEIDMKDEIKKVASLLSS